MHQFFKIVVFEKFCRQAFKWHLYSNTVKVVKPNIPGSGGRAGGAEGGGVSQAFKSSIKKVKNSIRHFLLNTYTDAVKKIFDNLNVAKNSKKNNTPTKIIKTNEDFFANFITDHFNYCISYGEFPDELKHADVIPTHKNN